MSFEVIRGVMDGSPEMFLGSDNIPFRDRLRTLRLCEIRHKHCGKTCMDLPQVQPVRRQSGAGQNDRTQSCKPGCLIKMRKQTNTKSRL